MAQYDTHYIAQTGVAGALSPTEIPAEDGDDEDVIVVQVNDRDYRVRLPEVLVGGTSTTRSSSPARTGARARSNRAGAAANGELKSPIQGTVLSVAVAAGDEVNAGDLICVVEAMKMENELVAPQSGVVSELAVEVGTTVRSGDLLAVIDGH